jgi:hypothetical protein
LTRGMGCSLHRVPIPPWRATSGTSSAGTQQHLAV